MSSTEIFPSYATVSGWNAVLAPRAIAAPPSSRKKFDFIIIGAGYTGLAAARQLALLKPELEILVLEGSVVGEGSSGRNSGFLINVPHNTKMSGHDADADFAKKQIAILNKGKAWLKSLIDEHGIDCAWSDIGKYHGAATVKGERGLRQLADDLRQWGLPCKLLNKEELEYHIGSPYYRFGLYSDTNVLVQPAALIRGLADSLPANVTLAERCPASSIEYKKGEYTVRTLTHNYKSNAIILANNGFAKHFGYLKDRLITIYTYAGMTGQLDDEQLNTLGADKEWGLIPANRLGTTLRLSQDSRFLVRTEYSYERPENLFKVKEILLKSIRHRYPQFEGYEFEHVWGGVTALTRNGAVYFGQLGPNIFASVGCNGAGVLKGSIYGKLLAESILGIDSEELHTVVSLDKPSWLPPEPLRKVVVGAAINRFRRIAGLER
ncbi:FAD-dependent oxidoreductase [Oligella urethralis]|uniref:NAD(P)/FAD-dependent oxidoreductase n=1 Tax=Oligella urethralis TaxID=90245 RepID=UPI00254A361C|nr:FAD-dependent oxidoreductase [Oligella urethralis]MDK6203193.1 FAD-dependent oxidoreductase [Oligella urethralis]